MSLIKERGKPAGQNFTRNKMKRTTKKGNRERSGFALIISMIFVLLFSTLAISLSSMCTTNVQIADNQRNANNARGCAESGLEVVRLWMSNVSIQGDTPPNMQFYMLAGSFDENTYETSDINIQYDGNHISIPSTNLGAAGKSFSATITPLPSADNPDTLVVEVTGSYEDITRTIRANYAFGQRASTVFDFGVATKGPLSLSGNIELEGVNVSVEASVYIESENDSLALSIIGNSQIAGDVSIVNPLANIYLQGGKAGIGGETGDDAIENHVDIGVPPTEFPIPNPSYFEQYVINTIDSSCDTSANATYENVRILADTNPHFSGNVILKGIVFIETPNIVTFSGNVTIIGIIIGDGDYEDNSGTNQINITGNVSSQPVTDLPDGPQFAGIKNETGTFLMAPGFSASFGGNFDTVNGAIAANGISFFGNAGGIINGSILNYSDEEMDLSGNADLYFNRSGTSVVPAGFIPEIVLQYEPFSYTEGPFD